jgi:hypothetical protein
MPSLPPLAAQQASRNVSPAMENAKQGQGVVIGRKIVDQQIELHDRNAGIHA